MPADPPTDNTTDWDLAADLFARAAEAGPDTREALLAGAAPRVRDEVEAMLVLDASATAFFAGGARVVVDAEAGPDTLAPGARLGAWTVGVAVGRGGMGTVYRAERADGRYAQTVALKAVRRGMDTDDVLARFRAEREILAGLAHPAIARVVDAGETPDGRPYLCMDFVDGTPLTDHADARRLGVPARLVLFADVCDAVAYAHRRLVVHRDLKPSNLLVTPEGQVRLLDFGIARVLSGDGTDPTRGPTPLTPEYAAPEQVRGEAVTTAADVYALGVVLHELLAGARPAGPDACPSQAALGAAVAQARSTTPEALRRTLRGDLDAIASRALRTEPEARYPSASALAADVRRYLAHEPVTARRGTRRYRAVRFVRRHRAGVAAAAVGVAALALFGATAAMQQRQTERERARAQAVVSFLDGLFADANVDETGRSDVRVTELLAPAAVRARAEFAGQPGVQAALLTTLGDAYAGLTRFDQARPLYVRALALARRLGDDALVEPAAGGLGRVEREGGRLDASEALYREAVAIARRRDGPRSVQTVLRLHGLALTTGEQGDYAAADSLFGVALGAIAGQATPAAAAERHALERDRAATLTHAGRSDEAVALFRRLLAEDVRRLGPRHPETAITQNDLGETLAAQGGHDAEALGLLTAALATRQRVYGDSSATVAVTLNNLSLVYQNLGRDADAEAAIRRSYQIGRALFGENSPNASISLYNLALAQHAHGPTPEAEASYRGALASHLAIWGPDHPYTAYVLLSLGKLYFERGDLDRAEPLERDTLRIRRAALPAGDWTLADAEVSLGRVLARRGRYAEALPLIARGQPVLLRERGADDCFSTRATEALAAARARRPENTVTCA